MAKKAQLEEISITMDLEFNRENFDNLIRLHQSFLEIAELGYKVSKSNLTNVGENLQKLNDRLYQFRNQGFRYPLTWNKQKRVAMEKVTKERFYQAINQLDVTLYSAWRRPIMETEFTLRNNRALVGIAKTDFAEGPGENSYFLANGYEKPTLEIKEDEILELGTLEFRDEKGNTVGKITNIQR